MTGKKKLIEVALPLEAINIACKADKDRKTGTIRNLHKWFAPMPPPAWRALLAAALLDDPGEPTRRQELFGLIEALLGVDARPPSREVVAELQRLLTEQGIELPIVFDPFCGGGSTLVEAQHLGLPTVGSDLNPIPVLITRTLTSYAPTVAGHKPITGTSQELLTPAPGSLSGFAQDVSHYAHLIYRECARKLSAFYPPGPNGDPIIAWWWARTIQSPDPRFQGAYTPLVNDWWLSKRKGLAAFVRPLVDREGKSVQFEIVNASSGAPHASKSECLFSGAPIDFSYIKEEGLHQRLGSTLMAVITNGTHGRCHFAGRASDVEVAESAQPLDPPRLALPPKALGFTVQQYGIEQWSQLFTGRQMRTLEVFADTVAAVHDWAIVDGAEEEYATAICTFLGLCVGKLAQSCSMQVRWRTRNGSAKAEQAFSQPTISPLWDFAEVNPFGGSVGDWLQVVETALRAMEFTASRAVPAKVVQRDARFASDLVGRGAALVATDPPYFSNFGYADPSNYFYIWLRRALKGIHPDLFSTLGAPTSGELISDPTRHGDDKDAAKDYFIDGLRSTFEGLAVSSRHDLPILVVYAFKQQEAETDGVVSTGWQAVLESLITAGLSIVGTWPIHGTGSARARGLSSNALATYVLLVCRPRPDSAPIGTFGEFRALLKSRLAEAVTALREASLAPVDLAQAVMGPGMEVFSGFCKVVQADGSSMSVREALIVINTMLDEVLEDQESAFDPSTRWAIAWFEQFGFSEGPFGVADSLARAKNTAVNSLAHAGLASAKSGVVRLLRPDELAPKWDPIAVERLTVWEATHHLVGQLTEKGESGAAELLRVLGGFGEVGRELAYRLHSICDRKKWSEEARLYNGLVVSWPEISRLARSGSLMPSHLFDTDGGA